MTFTVRDYRLGYAVWAAYRAAQAGSSKAKGKEFSAALMGCGVVSYIDDYDGAEISAELYKEKHDEWCAAIIKYIKDNFKKEITYGIAAKLLGIFVKGYFILAGNEEQPLSKVAHPPIDSFLLKGVDKEKRTKLDKEYKWQKLDKDKYYELLAKLKGHLGENEELWKIEKYWKLG
jgi:hypothetical protein